MPEPLPLLEMPPSANKAPGLNLAPRPNPAHLPQLPFAEPPPKPPLNLRLPPPQLLIPAAIGAAGALAWQEPLANEDAILDGLREKKPPVLIPPTFSGGQCPIQYRVHYTNDRTSYTGQRWVDHAVAEGIWGPILGFRIFWHPDGGGFADQILCYGWNQIGGRLEKPTWISLGGSGSGKQNWIAVANGITKIEAHQGALDNCGNAPPEIEPGEQRNGLPDWIRLINKAAQIGNLFPPTAPPQNINLPPNTPATIGTDSMSPTAISNPGSNAPQLHFPSPFSFNPNNPDAIGNTPMNIGDASNAGGGTIQLTSPGTSPVTINLPGFAPITIDPTGQQAPQGLTPVSGQPGTFNPTGFTPNPLTATPLTPTTFPGATPDTIDSPTDTPETSPTDTPEEPTTPTPPSTSNQPNTDLQTILTTLGIITTLVNQIKNNTLPDAIKDAAGAAGCKNAQPGGCTDKAIRDANADQSKGLKDFFDGLYKGVDLTLLGVINKKLGKELPDGLSGALGKLFNSTAVDRVISLATFAASIHNAMMLSTSIGETLFSCLDNIFAIPALIQSPDAETIDTKEVFTKYLDNYFEKLFGNTEWIAIKAQWKAYSTIYNTGAQVFGNVRDIVDETQNIQYTTNNWVAQLGNGLQDEGLIGEDNWDYKDPNQRPKGKYFRKLQRITEGLESIENVFEDLEQVTSSARSIVDSANEIKENTETINKAISEANKAAAEDRAAKEEGLELPNFSLEDLF